MITSESLGSSLTPLMQQYFQIKQNYPDAILLFQVGDFYELFYEDAKKAAACLAIALTARGKNNGEPIPLCGVPVHAIDHYLTKLIRNGFKVVLCNQLEPATPGKVVARGVTQVFTPGTLTDAALLDEKSASYLFSFFPGEQYSGLLFGELLTAQLFATVVSQAQIKSLEAEIGRFMPDEIILPGTKLGKEYNHYFNKLGYYTTLFDKEMTLSLEITQWSNQFHDDAKKYLRDYEPLQGALDIFYGYLKKNQVGALDQFRNLNIYSPEDFLSIDSATQRNLELVKNTQDGGRKNTLFHVMDGAVTAMGSRTIKKWLLRPLVALDAIKQRQDAIERFIVDISLAQNIRNLLQKIGDAERFIGRIILSRGSVHDYTSLLTILTFVPELHTHLQEDAMPSLLRLLGHYLNCGDTLYKRLLLALNSDTSKEWIIAAGFDERLDSLRALVEKSTVLLLEFEKREHNKTGISSLKVRYTTIQGYYIEITKPNAHLAPVDYIRTQSLVGKERFTTLELKKLEAEMNEARLHIDQVEKDLFSSLKAEVISHATMLRKIAQALSHLDALFGFAQVGYLHGYVRPIFNDQRIVTIKQGKHPVVAAHVQNHFISNDTQLCDEKTLWIITGPNMGGKSTYLRQVALISIMAQCGSFVPAQSANLPLFDKIFSRIGSGDNVAGGKSTFLVEMEETALICTQATPKSLIIFDEIGRGTSTFDGLAIAQAVIEYIYSMVKARCLFATHYHELTVLQKQFPGIVCYHAASKKTATGISLLYSIAQGHADGSFGIDVAKVAHMPDPIIRRAQEILSILLESSPEQKTFLPSQDGDESKLKIIIDQQEELLSVLYGLDYNNLSPKQAFDVLWDLKDRIDQKN